MNQTPILFNGWVEIKFRLPASEAPQLELLVPFLVTHEDGVAEVFNVIEYLLERGIDPPWAITEAVSKALFFDCKKAEVFFNVMKSEGDAPGVGTVKSSHPQSPEGLEVKVPGPTSPCQSWGCAAPTKRNWTNSDSQKLYEQLTYTSRNKASNSNANHWVSTPAREKQEENIK